MLRISVHNESQTLTFQLEGRLTAAWLEELAECWHRELSNAGAPNIRVDLTALTFVDGAGKKYLQSLHRQGARFVTADCETQSIVDEIARKSA
jgi:anti-anti-sigma regulatory factor